MSPDDPFPDLASRALDEENLPSVAELVDAVAERAGTPFARRGELFPAVQRVRAEERRMIHTGFEPSSLDELVARSIPLLPPDLGGGRFAGRGWGEDAPFEEEPLPPLTPPAGPDDPFGDDEFERRAEAPARLDPEPDNETPAPVEPEDDTDEVAAAPEADEPEEDLEPARDFAREGVRPHREGKFVTFLLLLAIAGGVWFFARSRRLPAPAPASPAADSGTGGAEPAVPGASPAPTPVVSPDAPARSSAVSRAPGAVAESPVAPPPPPPSPNAATASTSSAPPPALPESSGSSIVTSDWSGAPAYMIHFSSYQKKENAERDAARLSKLLGRPLRVVAVNIGKGATWYRVMLGEFSSREEADAARAELASKEAPGMGLVYRVSPAPR